MSQNLSSAAVVIGTLRVNISEKVNLVKLGIKLRGRISEIGA